jgi:putative transposase
MKRRHRKNINAPFHAHELTFSCYRGFPFLKVERTCQWLADSINQARIDHDFALWAYVFMPNHAHIIVYPRKQEYDIADIRKSIKEPVARQAIKYLEKNSPEWLAKITRRRGKTEERLFWQSGGGYDRNITEAETLLKMIDYIHANPIRKKYVAKPAEWKWSSAAWYLNQVPGALEIDRILADWLR